ncbi:hypothetical protein V4Y02_23955, partial [Escherichia coli]
FLSLSGMTAGQDWTLVLIPCRGRRGEETRRGEKEREGVGEEREERTEGESLLSSVIQLGLKPAKCPGFLSLKYS